MGKVVSTGRWSRGHYFSLSYIANTIKCFLIAITTIITLKCNLILCITGYLSMQSLEDLAWKRLSLKWFFFSLEASIHDQKQSGESILWACIDPQTLSVYLCLECHIYWAKSSWDLLCSPIFPSSYLDIFKCFSKSAHAAGAGMNLSHNHTNIVFHGMGTYFTIMSLHKLAVATLPQPG